MKPPFPWFGGKSRAAALIWAQLGDVENYIEPFAGSLAVMLNRPTEPGVETVNDKDRFVANFWRAVQFDAEAVAIAADNPVNECDLEARHNWLIQTGAANLASVLTDPDGYDAKIAGWWVWGQACWIGSGWCSGEGPWRVEAGEWVHLRNPGRGVNRKLPHLGDPGRGVNRKLPHLGDPGQGVNRQLPHLGNPGQGVNRQLPHLGNPGKARREFITEYLREVQSRIRHVRVACGDWRRVLTPSITFRMGTTGIVLDPPYGEGEVDYSSGGNKTNIAADVRAWALANGDNPELRIALCGYEGQHDMPESWSVGEWRAAGGYGSTAKQETQAKRNRHRERVWFSPACMPSEQLIPC
jgi:DNA adenine methylase